MQYDHEQLLISLLIQELQNLPIYTQQDILSSEENLVKFIRNLGFRVGFTSGAYYGVRGGAELIGDYIGSSETELDAAVAIGDIFISIIQGILEI